MLELGSVPTVGSALAELRLRVMAARRTLVEAGWPADPLQQMDRKTLDARLLSVQAELTEQGLNSKWCEKARIQAATAITRQASRARATFAGRLAHLDAKDDRNRATCAPDALLDRLSQADIGSLKQNIAAKNGFAAVVAEARRHAEVAAITDDGERAAACANLPPRDGILAWVLGHVLARFGQPEMDAPDRDGVVRQTVQLHLDKDCLRPVKKAYANALDSMAKAAPHVLTEGKPRRFELSLTPMSSGGDAIPLSVHLAPKPLLHLLLTEARSAPQGGGDEAGQEILADAAGRLRFRSICLEIGPETARVTAVVARAEAANAETVLAARTAKAKAQKAVERARQEEDAGKLAKAEEKLLTASSTLVSQETAFAAALARCTAVIGIDPGKRDAIAATPLCVPDERPLSADRVLEIDGFGRKEMRELFSSHCLPQPVRAGPAMSFSNSPFLALAATIAAAIDAASRAIDARYRRISVLKQRINLLIGCSVHAAIPLEAKDMPLAGLSAQDAASARSAHAAFFIELGRVRRRKEKRRALWDRLRGAKKSWFGLLSNRVSVMAVALDAAVALEDSDWGVEERASSDYRGRTHNRVMASVSPRKLLDAIKAKLDWSGVVWWNVPSWYTSKSDHRFGVVDDRQRKDKVFTALTDNMTMDADEHGAETISAVVMLRPLTELANLVKPHTCGLPALGSSVVYGRV